MTSANEIIWTIVFALEGASIVFLNFLGLVVFSRKVHRFKSSYMLMNQSLADLLIGARVILFAHDDILSQLAKFEQEDPYCGYRALKMFLWICVMEGSLASLSLIALERVYAVFKPFKHRILKSKHYIIAIATAWFMNLLRNIPLFVSQCQLKDKLPKWLVTVNMIFIGLFGLLIIIASYIAIYIKIKFYSMPQSTSQSQAQLRLNKTLFYATIASFVTILPSAAIMTYTLDGSTVHSDLLFTNSFILFSNSMINFIIYSWRIPGFSKDLKNALCCKKAYPIGVQSTDIELNVQN